MVAEISTGQSGDEGASACDRTAPHLDIEALERCVRHLIYRDLVDGKDRQHRRGPRARTVLTADPTMDLPLGPDGAGLDSLDLISAATAVSRFFDMGRSGMDDYLLFESTVGGWAGLVDRHLSRKVGTLGIIFETSGSTDRPTPVRRQLTDLAAEVRALAASAFPRVPERIVALPPPYHIFGWLFTVMLPARLACPVLDAAFRGAGSIMKELADGDLIIGTPFNWKTLLASGKSFPPGVRGITSAGPMPEELWTDLAAAGLSNLTEIFGSTETGGIGFRQAFDAPFALLPHLFRDRDDIRSVESGEALPLQDRLDWLDQERFQPEGRIDRAIQIAGVNVSLAKVRATLLQSDLVADAAVRRAGDRLKAFVVPSATWDSDDAIAIQLEEEMRAALDPVARPIAYAFGPVLPRNAMGKLQDW